MFKLFTLDHSPSSISSNYTQIHINFMTLFVYIFFQDLPGWGFRRNKLTTKEGNYPFTNYRIETMDALSCLFWQRSDLNLFLSGATRKIKFNEFCVTRNWNKHYISSGLWTDISIFWDITHPFYFVCLLQSGPICKKNFT